VFYFGRWLGYFIATGSDVGANWHIDGFSVDLDHVRAEWTRTTMTATAIGPGFDPARTEGAMLVIAIEKVGYILTKAREFDVKVGAQDVGPDRHPDPDDVDFRDILEDYADDPTATELRDAIDGLNVDEKLDLVALFWTGRGDYSPEEWEEAISQARDRYNNRTSDYLLGSPMLSDYLEEGLIKLGYSHEDFEP
jgi:hypothetical protein